MCAALVLVPGGRASAWCRMTTSLRTPTAAMPCVFPDASADPPEHFLEWRRPCSALALSVAAPSAELDDATVRAVLGRSIATWEAVDCGGAPFGIDLTLMDDTATCTEPLYRDDGANANTVLFVAVWDRSYDPAAFAVTTVWHRRSTGEILDVDLEVNEERGPFGVCPEEGCTDTRTVDLENVLTHELGHYLGLAHSTETDATMFASAVAGEVQKRDLHADDIEGLCTVYPPGSPVGACDPTPRGGLRLDCEEGGCAVARGVGLAPGPSPALALFAAVALLALRKRS